MQQMHNKKEDFIYEEETDSNGTCSFHGSFLKRMRSKPAEAPAETEAKTETEAKAETEAKEETEAKAEESAESSGDVKSVEGLTVAFVPKLTGNAFFESANNGAQKYAEKWGFTVDYQGSSNASVADQVQVINNAIASGVDGICISSVDVTGLDSALTDAISQRCKP